MSDDNQSGHSPFHEGELMVQEKLGVKEQVAKYAPRMIRDFMPDQHRELFEKLPFVILGGLDEAGDVWATIMAGTPGFVEAPDTTNLVINAALFDGDPLTDGLLTGSKVGFLGLETTTRRRNRMNGRVAGKSDQMLAIKVEQSFGNCPQYIQKRTLEITRGSAADIRSHKTDTLSDSAKQTIEQADTFFIASRTADLSDDPATGLDVSHRGGMPGFIEIVDDTTIRIPDYAGNRIYNTIGNIMSDGRVGLLFVDHEQNALLQISGVARIIWDDELTEQGPEGRGKEVERMIEVECKSVVQTFNSAQFSEALIERSPIFKRFAKNNSLDSDA
ncbi:pyridoxamine 5'-phosphate oxidase family protein [Kordiimonas sp. SCSIO 12610]|uniref:pyridoxamine 5'-phosphate oxidase family protein n=1 Tax=Kordiimonas sp. SCSIO 12610 TaxID=2829597 RepID=UPI00210CFFA4|nr:pyridoxamine 5'-phosphate oxidase family protein [Kordiimonas sp. SCSIO 12610]UTW56284.1 pyridoxamine 5'-phosphate oxidase family protein [Kordiimonas sp. SCSIO 12610]